MKKFFVLLAIVSLLSGCSYFKDTSEVAKSVDVLVSEGSTAFLEGDFKKAIKAYTNLKDWYPFSRYADLAELKIADSYFHLEEYQDAIMAYEEFERMHPKNEAVPYVVYQIGMCWFNQIGEVNRDGTPAKKSLDIFNRLNRQYPDSEYAGKTEEKIKHCFAIMSGHELYVANWYLKTKQYKAALNRYKYLVKTFPDSKESKEALAKIPEVKALLNKK